MKQNTHDWDAIRCRRGTLLLIEMVIPTGNGAAPKAFVLARD